MAQERQAREQAVSGQLAVLRRELPRLLERLGKIPDLRNPHRCRHRLTVLLLDGLYANGPVMRRCRQLNWQFMIVLKDKDLTTVWEEFESLRPLQPENRLQHNWGERRQYFFWVNAIDYEFTQAGRKHLTLHVVVCEETWEKINDKGETLPKSARHAWISSCPPSREARSTNAATSARATAGASRRASWWKNTKATTTSTPSPWIETP